jgi:hypothetical protein
MYSYCSTSNITAIFRVRTSSIIYENYIEINEDSAKRKNILLLSLEKYGELEMDKEIVAATTCILFFANVQKRSTAVKLFVL